MKDEIALVASLVIIVVCALGLSSKQYKDNWAQHIGLIGITIACLMTAHHAWTTQRTSLRVMLLLVALAVYACGTAWKHWMLNRKPVPPSGGGKETPYKLEVPHGR